MCVFWLQMREWTARVEFRDRGVGYQGSCWGAFVAAVFMNLRQKQQRKNRKRWKDVERKLSEVVMDG